MKISVCLFGLRQGFLFHKQPDKAPNVGMCVDTSSKSIVKGFKAIVCSRKIILYLLMYIPQLFGEKWVCLPALPSSPSDTPNVGGFKIGNEFLGNGFIISQIFKHIEQAKNARAEKQRILRENSSSVL